MTMMMMMVVMVTQTRRSNGIVERTEMKLVVSGRLPAIKGFQSCFRSRVYNAYNVYNV